MPDHRQKKLARHKKKRASVQRSHARGSVDEQTRDEFMKKLVREAPSFPEGPCFIASTWNDPSASRVLPVAITRRLSADTLVMVIFLVDLGCFGLKDAILTVPFKEARIGELLQNLANLSKTTIESVPIALASAVIRKAILWGAKLGFAPEADDSELLTFLSPASDEDVEVRMGRDGKVVYEPDPGEDTQPIVQKLVQTVGPDGFIVVLPNKPPEPPSATG
ncbi:MAG: hypothetical protein HY898_18025 [Deltaproteobacteria bacterium]|nr:hypothetical protein [Deltaproteobacteria bacterium]